MRGFEQIGGLKMFAFLFLFGENEGSSVIRSEAWLAGPLTVGLVDTID